MKAAARFLLALACLLLLALPVAAQPAGKVPLAFISSARDDIGASIASRVREQLRRSAAVTLTPDQGAAWLWASFMSVRIEGSAATAYALVLGINDGSAWSGASYWASQVGNCGSDVTDKCAATVLAFIDQSVSAFQAENARRTTLTTSKP